MDLDDLRLFRAVAGSPSLWEAAAGLGLTPSALSKAVRRLEGSLHTTLFDRANGAMRLNAAGALLLERAGELLRLADQTRSEFAGAAHRVRCRVAGPAVLLWRYGAELAAALSARDPAGSLTLRSLYEREAVAALARGEADFALATAEVTDGPEAATLPRGAGVLALPPLPLVLAAGPGHPLAASPPPDAGALAGQPFACPSRSPFCGLERGAGSDGWPDAQAPRAIRYRVDDLQVLVGLVRAGAALAHLPAFAVREAGLVALDPGPGTPRAVELPRLVWLPTRADGWQRRLVRDFLAGVGDEGQAG